MTSENMNSIGSERKFSVLRHDDANKNPIVSVIVPIYNADYTLYQAIESLMNQTLHDIEIVCVNDASPDNSPSIIEELFATDKRITIVQHENNSGYGASMNDGIQAASGVWIGILEPDDYVKPEMFEKMIKASGKSGILVDIVKTPYLREVRAEGVKRGDAPKEILNCSYKGRIHPERQPFDIRDEKANHLLRHHPSIWSAIYRKSFIECNNIRFVEYSGAGWADNEFFYETLMAADNIVYLDEPFYVYREETDDEFDLFARNNKTLPFDRWHSMSDIIRKYGNEENENVMRSHISKGFTYLSGEIKANTDENGNIDPVVLEEMNKMFDEMEPLMVMKEPKISPALKHRFIQRKEYLDENVPRNTGIVKYYVGLAGELVYAIKNNGVSFAMAQVKKVLGR